jgi:FeS assembly protein IscX
MNETALYWDNEYEIVLSLMEHHANVVVDDVGVEALYQMVIALPNFADDPLLANEGILMDILREWYEESNP